VILKIPEELKPDVTKALASGGARMKTWRKELILNKARANQRVAAFQEMSRELAVPPQSLSPPMRLCI
jgi:hypothetical protein